MPHYADGSPAKVGDVVQHVSGTSFPKVMGLVVSITEGSTSCNAQVLPFAEKHGELQWIPSRNSYNFCVTLGEMARLEPWDCRKWMIAPEEMVKEAL